MATEKSENQVFWDLGEANSGFEPVKRRGVSYGCHEKKKKNGHEMLTTEEGLGLDATEAALGIIPEL